MHELSATNKELALLIAEHGLNQDKLYELVESRFLDYIEDLHEDTLVLLLIYIKDILEDDVITEQEAGFIRLLKRFLKIKEGDLYQYHRHMVVHLLRKQMVRIYEDDKVDAEEALEKVNLQELFDLGYDQFLDIVNDEVKVSLSRGGRLDDLDTYLKNYKGYNGEAD